MNCNCYYYIPTYSDSYISRLSLLLSSLTFHSHRHIDNRISSKQALREMRRVRQQDLYQNMWSTSDDDDDNMDDNIHGEEISLKPSSDIHLIQQTISSNPIVNRLCLLPAYPTFDRFGPINRDHLLLPNVPRRDLSVEQGRRRDRHLFHQPFTLIDQSNDMTIRPHLVDIYEYMYCDLVQRFQVDNAILDYNYKRLGECINMMTQERVRYGFLPENTVGSRQLRMEENVLALEFYLQFDGRISSLLQ